MKPIVFDEKLVAKCGLYCGTCRAYLKNRCPGCAENNKATWCKVRTCCLNHHYQTCADCREFTDPNRCKKFNNWMSKIFIFLFRSNRKACIERIRAVGTEQYAKEMTEAKIQSL